MNNNSPEEYCPVNVQRAEWAGQQAIILAQRKHFLLDTENEAIVFENIADANSHHYFARINDELVGYFCIDPDGHISFANTSASHAVDIADALLRFAVLDAPRRGLSQLSAPAAHPWKDALHKLGFSTTNSKNDSVMTLFLPPDRSFIASGSDLVRLEQVDTFKNFAVQLAKQARFSVVIFSEDLEAWLYDNEEFSDALMELVQRSRNSSVRFLVRDTKTLLERGHRLLRLSHSASDKIHIRKLPSMLSEKYPCYMIADDNGLLLRQDSQVVQGIGYTDYRARVKPLLEEFKLLWARSTIDPDLRQHTL
jgi:hypothetical protein